MFRAFTKFQELRRTIERVGAAEVEFFFFSQFLDVGAYVSDVIFRKGLSRPIL
jgi:hypothetical protein